MFIVDNTQIGKRFCEIRFGTVFKKEYEGTEPYYCMKVPKFLDEPSQKQCNAIDLEDGGWRYFEEYEEIIPYEATLHLEI